MADTKVIVIPEGKICDYIDGKFRNDTPEEYVRQTVEKRLVNEHKYFPEQIRVEYTLPKFSHLNKSFVPKEISSSSSFNSFTPSTPFPEVKCLAS